jgi:hypothetical protein
MGCSQGLLYTWVSLSHVSLLVVGIRACKVMGEIRFAGSVTFSIILSQREHQLELNRLSLRCLFDRFV